MENLDLPPRWDGYEVTWDGRWESSVSSLALHLPDLGACEECGSVRSQVHRWGTYWWTWERPAHMPLRDGPEKHLRRIMAQRCQDCEHTTVTEMETHETWDIDESDLTDEGSYDERVHQLTLF